MSMIPGTVFIAVWNCRVAVSRYVAVAGGLISVEPAKNWPLLEVAANDAVEEQGGSFNLSGHYRCPHSLAALAEWPVAESEKGRQL